MVQKRTKTKTITLESGESAFSAIFKRFRSEESPKISDVSLLRSILSNEKARILHALKTKQPNSIYGLAKILGRDFKSVRQDIRVLEEFGMIEMIPLHKGNRGKLKPLLVVDELNIKIVI